MRKRLAICLTLVPLFLLCRPRIAGAAASEAGPNAPGQIPVNAAEATRVDRAPKLDGTLDDPLWQTAKPITDFHQREPYEGQSPTERTEVRILYTRHAVYFGIHCYDSEPSRIVATELRRDVSQDLDDHFEILIDSNHDRRGAYVFQINPLGTQVDGLIVEEQGSSSGPFGTDFDSGWDGVWTSEAHITAGGWSATIEIPFTTLNFTRSTDVLWGLNFKRFIRRKNEEDLWRAYRRTFGTSTPMPMVLRTRSYKPCVAGFVGLMQHAKNTSSSFSNSPKSSLQLLQLGAVHRWTSSGVVSGYRELGNT